MYEITSEAHFSAAHRLLNYDGPCENLHGHNWQVKASVKCSELDSAGIGIDFKVLRNHLKEIVKQFDHKDLNVVLKQENLNPSSENLARYIFQRLKGKLEGSGCMVSRLEICETPGNCAAYYE